jgi:hypothetical protein
MSGIPGYAHGTAAVPRSPITLSDLDLLRKTLLLGDEDVKYLRLSGEVLRDQVEAVLDVWYGFVGSTPHLLHYFTNKADGQPNMEYLGAVRKRFAQWILDTAAAKFDQPWLDYQIEIGRRHHRVGKNRTDGVATVDHIPVRYVVALTVPVTFTLKNFLGKKGHPAEEVEKMHQAWIKSVLLQTILWSHPYVKDGDF